MSPSAHGIRTVQPLHFFVEDALISGTVPLERWNHELLQVADAAEALLCEEMKRAEKTVSCDLSFHGAMRVTYFDKSLEDGLRRTRIDGRTPDGAVNQEGVYFLFNQQDPSERRIFVVRQLLGCDGIVPEAEACTRISESAAIITGHLYPTNDIAVTLLHELGHQVGLNDAEDPSSLMYGGRPVRRAGTKLNAAEAAHFRRLLALPEQF